MATFFVFSPVVLSGFHDSLRPGLSESGLAWLDLLVPNVLPIHSFIHLSCYLFLFACFFSVNFLSSMHDIPFQLLNFLLTNLCLCIRSLIIDLVYSMISCLIEILQSLRHTDSHTFLEFTYGLLLVNTHSTCLSPQFILYRQS